MRKLILSMNITEDGFIAGANGELDWHFRYWNEEMSVALCKLLSTADSILLGRKTYTALADYWSTKGVELSISREDIALAEMLNRCEKIVVSRTLSRPAWVNSSALKVKDDLHAQIIELKQKRGKNIVILGSASLVACLIAFNLVDEYHLWIHPTTITVGNPLVTKLGFLELLGVERLSTGVIRGIFGSRK